MADPRLAARAQPAQPVFFFDLCSPLAYLAAERVNAALPVVPEWEPILLTALPGAETLDAWRCDAERESFMEDVARRAAAHDLQPLRWPARWPADSESAMLAATYAKGIGRAVAFSLAAFRQAFAAGRDLGDLDNVCIAAAACEVHPAALLKGIGLRSTREGLDRANRRAAAAGVRSVPALVVGSELFEGDAAVEAAAVALPAA